MTSQEHPAPPPDLLCRLVRAAEAYERRFNRPPPVPYGLGADTLAWYLERAVRTGKPGFNPWRNLPPDSVA